MEKFANEGGMITEQLWDADDLPDGRMKRGQPTGAAMPLCWSHAEYLSLVRSGHDGSVLTASNRPISAMSSNRWQAGTKCGALAIRSAACRPEKSCASSSRRTQPSSGPPTGWASTNKADTTQISALDLWFADLPTENCPDGSVIEFTFFWKEARRWEGRNYSVAVTGQSSNGLTVMRKSLRERETIQCPQKRTERWIKDNQRSFPQKEMQSSFSPIFDNASPQAAAISDLFMVVLAICGVILAIIVGMVGVGLIRFSADHYAEPSSYFGNRKLEIIEPFDRR